MKYCLAIGSLFFLMNVYANNIILQEAPIHPHDKTSVQRGAKFFATHCVMCHSLKYLINDPVANAAGINANTMPTQAKNYWAGNPPPDLSLVAKYRGVDWIYTYLHSFYQDDSRPSKNNNLLVTNTNMPNPFLTLQGTQVLVINKSALENSGNKEIQWFDAVELKQQGSMKADDFDKTIADVTNFLLYASDPNKEANKYLGFWVVGYLIIFLLLAYLLKKVIWKNIRH